MGAITGLLCHHLAGTHISDLWGVVMLKTFFKTYVLLMCMAICLFMIIAVVAK